MGLNEDELILCIEDEFGITIADEEAYCARTAQDFHGLVLSKLEPGEAGLEAVVFYRTRKVLAEVLGTPSRAIGPLTRLEGLMPLETRGVQWKQLSWRSGLVFPRLTHPKRWKDRFLLMSMAVAAVPVVALWWSLHVLGWLPGILLYLFAAPAFVAWFVLISRINQKLLVLTPWLANEIPFKTAAELSMSVLALNETVFERAVESIQGDKQAIWNRIAEVVGRELKVDPLTVSPGMRVVGLEGRGPELRLCSPPLRRKEATRIGHGGESPLKS
jgi:hypothetical protein